MLYIYKMKSVGSRIKEIVEKRGMAHSEFARRINRSPQNIYDLFKRKTIDIELLAEIGQVLEYDFFQHYTDKHKSPDKTIKVEEESVGYKTPGKAKVISLVIELDGSEATEMKWIQMIRDINLVVRANS